MKVNLQSPNWSFGLQWILTTVAGLVAGGMLGFSLMWGVGEALQDLLGETAAYAISGGLFGALLGLGANLGPGQLLHNYGVRAGRWMAASVIAGALGMAASMIVILSLFDPEAMSTGVAGAVFGMALGLPLGIGQWWVLARSGVAATMWPLVSAVAFSAGMTIGLPLGGENREWLSLAVIGLAIGVLTALGMMWQLRRRPALAL